jgi:hypothetical protein
VLIADVDLTPQERIAFDTAFERACDELGLSQGSLDVVRRERVAQFIIDSVCSGEQDIDVLHRRAVFHFRNTFSECG